MEIKNLKSNIINKTLSDQSMIWVYSDNKFLCEQYIQEISKIKGYDICYLDNLDRFKTISIFDSVDDSCLFVYNIQRYEDEIDLSLIKNLIIVTNKYKGKFDYCDFPKLEQWQIIDYVYSICNGVDKQDLDWLMELCNYDIYRLQQEINKILIFPEVERKYLFKDFISSDIFSDLANKTIYDFSNAIQSKNIHEIVSIYKQLENCDIEPLGLVTILYNNFRKMIRVVLQKFATEENTGLKKNQIYAIKKASEKYNNQQLIDIFKLLCGIDFKLKTGEMPADLILDYVTLNVISM